jgi:hypothetical protein
MSQAPQIQYHGICGFNQDDYFVQGVRYVIGMLCHQVAKNRWIRPLSVIVRQQSATPKLRV